MSFDDQQLLRYSRQILVKEFDIVGQQALANAHVLIVGIGGLGCPAALYLSAAGIGNLYLMDKDSVELSNLQRQILFDQQQLDSPKTEAAKQKIEQLNHHVRVTALQQTFDAKSLDSFSNTLHLVLDCTDNGDTRKIINQSCFSHKLPLISGAAMGWQGQLTSFDFRTASSPCYQCLFDEIPNHDDSCSANGIISPVVGMIGVMQALETIKFISGCGTTSLNKLRCFDGFSGDWRSYNYKKDINCPICG